MSGPAKFVNDNEFKMLLAHVFTRRKPERSAVMILLSYKAGLRACEVAGLDWSMVTTGSGALADSISVSGTIAKNGRARRIPMHPQLRDALRVLNRNAGKPRNGPVIRSQRGGHLTPGSVVNWFTALYAEMGFQGCSSHSGRRTFITKSARMVAKVGGCLRDVQELAGHSALSTTEIYLVSSRDAQHKLMRLL
jgi:integrase